MPDILKPRNLIETGDKVRIPDVEILVPPPPQPPQDDEGDAEFREINLTGEDGAEPEDAPQEGETDPESQPEPDCEPEPELPVLTKEELAAYFQEELADLYQSEAQRGYADAAAQIKGELRECIARVDAQLAQMEALQTQFMTQVADELCFLAVDIAEKLIYTRITQDDLTLQKLVMQTVSGIKNSDWLDVEISENLVGLVEALKRELEKPEYRGRATVTPAACPMDTVRVSSQDGTVVASVSTQSNNLRDIFRKN